MDCTTDLRRCCNPAGCLSWRPERAAAALPRPTGAHPHADPAERCLHSASESRNCRSAPSRRKPHNAHRLGRPQRSRRDTASLRRHQPRQRRRPLVLFQRGARVVPRHRFRLQRQGRSISLVPDQRHALGHRQERRRPHRFVESDLSRPKSRKNWFRLKNRDRVRFELLLITPPELTEAGFGRQQADRISRSISAAPAAFPNWPPSKKLSRRRANSSTFIALGRPRSQPARMDRPRT